MWASRSPVATDAASVNRGCLGGKWAQKAHQVTLGEPLGLRPALRRAAWANRGVCVRRRKSLRFRVFALFPRCARGRKPKISAPYSPWTPSPLGPRRPPPGHSSLRSSRRLPVSRSAPETALPGELRRVRLDVVPEAELGGGATREVSNGARPSLKSPRSLSMTWMGCRPGAATSAPVGPWRTDWVARSTPPGTRATGSKVAWLRRSVSVVPSPSSMPCGPPSGPRAGCENVLPFDSLVRECRPRRRLRRWWMWPRHGLRGATCEGLPRTAGRGCGLPAAVWCWSESAGTSAPRRPATPPGTRIAVLKWVVVTSALVDTAVPVVYAVWALHPGAAAPRRQSKEHASGGAGAGPAAERTASGRRRRGPASGPPRWPPCDSGDSLRRPTPRRRGRGLYLRRGLDSGFEVEVLPRRLVGAAVGTESSGSRSGVRGPPLRTSALGPSFP